MCGGVSRPPNTSQATDAGAASFASIHAALNGENAGGDNPAERLERLRNRLRDAEGDHAVAWKPEVGDELHARFIRWDRATTRRGESYPVAILETVNGEHVAAWGFYRVLLEELQKADPQPGEWLLIRRGEDRTNAEAMPYRVYAVAVDREADAQRNGAPLPAPPMDELETDPRQTDWTVAAPRDTGDGGGAF